MNGLFSVELKSWALSYLDGLSGDGVLLRTGEKARPWVQARSAAFSLKNRIERDRDCMKLIATPWITPAVSLYNIAREDFQRRFIPESGSSGDAEFLQRVSRTTLFREDLDSWTAFMNTLLEAQRYPLFGAQPPDDLGLSDQAAETLRALNGVLHPSLTRTRSVSAYDKDRVRQLEVQEAKDLERPDWSEPVVCTGYAGTGKTVLGLKAALQRLSNAGGRGVFVCYNKVLATDIDRLLQLSPAYAPLSFDVFDVFQFLRSLAAEADVPCHYDPQNLDGSAESVCRDLVRAWRASSPGTTRPDYRFIVIDEAQDLKGWGWDLLNALQLPTTEFMVIDAKDQQFYNAEKAQYLVELTNLVRDTKKTNFIEKRRVFRTTDTTYLISQIFADSFPNTEHARARWTDIYKPLYESAKRKKAPGERALVEFPRQHGDAPAVHYVDPQRESALESVTRIVETGLKKTTANYREDQPCGLLILVPFQEGSASQSAGPLNWNDIARCACRACDLKFVDYSDDRGENRRRGYAGDEARISTFHSSKGIEGLHVIVLGFDSLADAAPRAVKRGVSNLGYVVLSRSQYDTDVVCLKRTTQKNPEVGFLEEVIQIVGN